MFFIFCIFGDLIIFDLHFASKDIRSVGRVNAKMAINFVTDELRFAISPRAHNISTVHYASAATFFFLALFGLLPLLGRLDCEVDSLLCDFEPSRLLSWPYSSRMLSLKLTSVLIGTLSRTCSSASIA